MLNLETTNYELRTTNSITRRHQQIVPYSGNSVSQVFRHDKPSQPPPFAASRTPKSSLAARILLISRTYQYFCPTYIFLHNSSVVAYRIARKSKNTLICTRPTSLRVPPNLQGKDRQKRLGTLSHRPPHPDSTRQQDREFCLSSGFLTLTVHHQNYTPWTQSCRLALIVVHFDSSRNLKHPARQDTAFDEIAFLHNNSHLPSSFVTAQTKQQATNSQLPTPTPAQNN